MTSTEVWTALGTPFHADDSIDWAAFEKMLEHQSAAGVTGVALSGSTGESPTLGVQEKLSLIKKAKGLLGKKLQVMAGVGSSDTNQTAELARLAQEAGADSLLVVTPAYSRPNFAGLKAHYKKIAQSSSLPLCLYVVPGRTGLRLTAGEILELCAEIPSITSVKEASADVSLFANVCSGASANPKISKCKIYTGDDISFLTCQAIGSHGLISVASNIFPRALVAIAKHWDKHEPGKALEIFRALLPFFELLFCESNPTPLKAALSICGLAKNHVRLPLAPVSKSNEERLSATIHKTTTKLKEMGLL